MSSKSKEVSLLNFETKKALHFNITREAHSKLRISCFKYRLSMQELFEEIAQKIAAESPDLIKIMEDLATRKRERSIKKLSQDDAESIFSIIEHDNPLAGEK